MRKRVDQLTCDDLARHPVWRYFEDKSGVVVASPVRRVPVRSLDGRLIGCQVALSNGMRRWAELSNIDLHNETSTSQFLMFSVLNGNGSERFCLARYFDVDYANRGPLALSRFLGLPAEEIFPVAYDIGSFVDGATIPTAGLIPAEPAVRLSKEQLMALLIE